MKLVDHLLDRGAMHAPSNQNWLEVIGVIVPAIIANVIPFYGPVRDAMVHVPNAQRVLRITVPLLSGFVCMYLILSNKPSTSGLAPIASQPRYQFGNTLRQSSKLILLFLVPLIAFELIDNMPRNVLVPGTLDGYFCSAGDGRPLAGVVIQAYDALDQPISKESASADGDGYFALTLARGAARAHDVRGEGMCGPLNASIGMAVWTNSGCPAQRIPPPRRKDARLWSFSCVTK